jgi:hypothetical protein
VSQAVVYEYVPVVIEEVREKGASESGYVSKYRVIETKHRVVVTKILMTLLAPDGKTIVSRYDIPTRIVETEYSRGVVTVYVGVVKTAETPQPVTIQPVTGGGGTTTAQPPTTRGTLPELV